MAQLDHWNSETQKPQEMNKLHQLQLKGANATKKNYSETLKYKQIMTYGDLGFSLIIK